MLTIEEIKMLVEKAPKGFKTPEDEFFTPTNQKFSVYKKLGVISTFDSENTTVKNEGICDEVNATNEIQCNILGCLQVFNSVSTYQTHFNTLHKYLCAQCRRSLPTAHLLDIHVSETHDSYFAACVERGNAEFKCFIDECKEKLRSPNERKKHCIVVHKFPASYRFDQLKGKKQKKKRKTKRRSDVDEIKSSDSMDESEMRADIESKKVYNFYTFGHQKSRFAVGKTSETFENMTELMDALND